MTFLRKINRNLLYLLLGVAASFAMMQEIVGAAGTSAYMASSISYGTLLIFVSLFSAILFALLAKLLVYISFRINGAIFTKKNAMFSPFPIGFTDFEYAVFAFFLPACLFCGAVMLPAFFIPTLSSVLGAVRTSVIWWTVAAIAAYLVKMRGHDYDRKSLAFSLSIVPMIFVGLSLVLCLVEVVR